MKVDIFTTDKKYDIIYADPPYRFSQGISARKTFLQKGFKEELNIHYKTMSDKEIIAFKFSQIAAENSVLLCWTTDAHLPVCLEMIKQNGFIYKTVAFVWDKMKAYAGNRHPSRALHPTEKPVGLLELLIKTYTDEGDIVLDNCMGCGSTGVACVNTHRKFVGIEKNDKYFEIAKRRINEAKSNNGGDQCQSV